MQICSYEIKKRTGKINWLTKLERGCEKDWVGWLVVGLSHEGPGTIGGMNSDLSKRS